ncbi:MAG TPA: hypothetical protein QGF05_01925, partial [Dehalococcoidia bacterium]|nr:hypothetical protein [Dehalococcoidia bacterium]
SIERRTTRLGVMQFMAASWMWSERFFYDPEVATAMGLEGPIIPGPYKHLLLQQYLIHWLGRISGIRRLQVSHRRPDLHEGVLTLGGAITRKYEDDGHRLADLELFIDQESGERSVRASATVEF